MTSIHAVGRLSLYRRLLKELVAAGEEHIYSHELAALSGGTAAQVRRDIMLVGHSGSPARGYRVEALLDEITRFLHTPGVERCALVGVGNLGRALLAYFPGRSSHFHIVAAFDSDTDKIGRLVHGCRCYGMSEMEAVIAREAVHLGLIAVPASGAQETADRLCKAGVKGLLNFAPVRIWAPEDVYIENMDVTLALERAAFFARHGKSASD